VTSATPETGCLLQTAYVNEIDNNSTCASKDWISQNLGNLMGLASSGIYQLILFAFSWGGKYQKNCSTLAVAGEEKRRQP
jgi:hypothetical protein